MNRVLASYVGGGIVKDENNKVSKRDKVDEISGCFLVSVDEFE